MNATKKKIGDKVRITAGQFKNQIGKLITKERRGWTVELEDGQQVAVSFPMVVLVEAEESPQAEASALQTEPTEEQTPGEFVSEVVEQEQSSDSDGEESKSKQVDEITTQTEEGTDGKDTDLSKMTVKQLQALAKQRGIGIARTKSDFLRIIKEKNPDEDLDQLKGKTLFDRVTELHISRLRTKADLVRMLTA